MSDSTDTTHSSEEKTVAVDLNEEAKEGKRDLFRALLLCVLAVVVVRSFLFEPFKIPSSSMVPTLKIGDHIFVSKFNFGLTVPFSKIEFVRWSQPKRGDVIVFLFPRDESLHYIKRVVGVPGDTVEFVGKDLVVNGKTMPKELISDPKIIAQVAVAPDEVDIYRETIGDSIHYVQYSKRVNHEFSRRGAQVTVPPDQFFVSGDNRDDSYDSRSWGFVPRENIKGRAQIVWLSLDQEQSWGKLNKIRWQRCGTLIH